MANSFGTVTFTSVLFGGESRSISSDVSVQHIPGSSTNYIDIAGAGVTALNFKLYFNAEANYFLMEGKVGTQGTLTCLDGTIANTLLRSISRTFRGPNGDTFADAEFIIP